MKVIIVMIPICKKSLVKRLVIIVSMMFLSQMVSSQRYTALNCPGETVADQTRVYAAVSAGASGFGKVWTGSIEGYSLTLGVEGAYFFKKYLGAGLIYHTSRCDIEIKDVGVIGKDIISFLGPAIYGRYGLRRSFIFTGSAGVGMLNWAFSRYIGNNYEYGVYTSTVGGFVSLGGCYLITQNLGAGVRVQSTIGSIKNKYFERNPTALGCTLNLNFYF